jgi:hypothetical protein
MTRTFTLEEAEALRRQLEPQLRRLRELYQAARRSQARLERLRERIRLSGGYYALPETTAIVQRIQRRESAFQRFLDSIQRLGVIVRDVETGLVDFPGELEGEPVYWCWKLDEARILYYHRPDEGFQGRKPIPFERVARGRPGG